MTAPNLTGSGTSQPLRLIFAAACVVAAVALALSAVPGRAATLFYLRGGGDGHGIGMSQYGSYGYAQHGKGYRWILRHYYRGTALGRVDPQRTVRVLLADGPASFSGAVHAAGVTKALQPGLTYSVRPNADGSLALLGPDGKPVVKRAPAPLTVTGPGPLQLAGLGAYRGALEFRPDGAGGVQTVEAVGLDDYVRGVISAEMPASWSPQALMVQAVAARTYAITTDVAGRTYDLYSDTRSQMYRGVAAETAATDAAVAATRGQVVTYGGVPVVTYFFNSSGGHTENVENVWPGATPQPWLRGVSDPYDGAGGDPYHRWGLTLTPAAAAARLGSLVRGRLIGIRVLRHGASPRVLTAQVVGTKGATTVSGPELQHLFGLLTTYMVFTTISVDSGPGKHGEGVLAPLLRELLDVSLPAVHGSVFPAAPGARFALQMRRNGRWRTVVRGARIGRDGTFERAVPATGVYRIAYRGLTGPAITVR